MHTRVIASEFRPDRLDEGVGIFRDAIVPAAREQRGFVSALLLVDRNAGRFVSITVWETEADMLANEASGYLREQVAKAAAIFAKPPTTDRYEVAVRA